MNPELLPQIAALLGHIQPPSTTQQVPPDAQMPPQAELHAAQSPFPPSKYPSGLFKGGPFALGHTGSRILGAIGDAFLSQGGRAPQYAPHLREAREAEAMQNFTTDPMRAIQMLNQIDPNKAAALWQQYQKNQQDAAEQTDLHGVREAQTRAANDAHVEFVNNKGLSLLSAATPGTFDKMRQRVIRYFKDNSVEPDFDIPDTYDEAAIHALRRAGVSPEKQVAAENATAYRDAAIAAANMRAAQAQAGQNSRTDKVIKGENDRNSQNINDRRDRDNKVIIPHNQAMEAIARNRTGHKGVAPQLVLKPDGSYGLK